MFEERLTAAFPDRAAKIWSNLEQTRGGRRNDPRFGSRMDTYLPVGTAIRIAVGNRVTGGETILGELQ